MPRETVHLYVDIEKCCVKQWNDAMQSHCDGLIFVLREVLVEFQMIHSIVLYIWQRFYTLHGQPLSNPCGIRAYLYCCFHYAKGLLNYSFPFISLYVARMQQVFFYIL